MSIESRHGPGQPDRNQEKPSVHLAPLYVPEHTARRSFKLSDAHRDRGIHWVAGSGSGKSMSLGYLAFFDFLRGVPQVLFDPTGPMVDAFLLLVAELPPEVRRKVWRHIRYVDMSGRGVHTVSLPLLHALPNETLQDVADRFLNTCKAIDPHLQSASIQGFNALYRIGAPAGVVLASLGLQLDHALDLFNHPEGWLDRFEEAVRRHPQAQAAVDFMQNVYIPLSRGERLRMTSSYRTKLEEIMLDPTLRDMLCTSPPDLDFAEVVRNRQTLILDFRGETNERKRLLKSRWVYDLLLAYIRSRGAGKHRPLAIHFDEITELTNQASLDHDLFARDLDYLFNVLQRNYSCWITAAHQQMWQLSRRTQETLLSLGTQIIGSISDMQTAELLARRYCQLDPWRVKRQENVWGSVPVQSPYDDFGTVHVPQVLEQRDVDFPLDQQVYLAARRFLDLGPFEFAVKPRNSTTLTHISLAGWVGNPWPNEHEELLANIRTQLARRIGIQRSESDASPPDVVDVSDRMEGTRHEGIQHDVAQPDYAAIHGEDIDEEDG